MKMICMNKMKWTQAKRKTTTTTTRKAKANSQTLQTIKPKSGLKKKTVY